MEVLTSRTINGSIVEEVGRIKEIVFYRVKDSYYDLVYLVNNKSNKVIGSITCNANQNVGYIDEIKEL